MESKTISIITIILSTTVTLIWGLGLIFADINLFILSMIILLITIFPVIKYFDKINEYFSTRNGKVKDDERTEFIDGKVTLPAYAVMIAASSYGGIAIITLRNIYPEYINLAYPLFIVAILGIISHLISSVYYKRKYSD